jgi:hypothetical protein
MILGIFQILNLLNLFTFVSASLLLNSKNFFLPPHFDHISGSAKNSLFYNTYSYHFSINLLAVGAVVPMISYAAILAYLPEARIGVIFHNFTLLMA